ncbi:MAG: right-handed parallel beta-helix repeat-containing protein [Candidatus Latescibacteria bacterium]|nr:right-handed parallel beta-helix repeat-containing protein [Candidatus Latescibacterota bacterium]
MLYALACIGCLAVSAVAQPRATTGTYNALVIFARFSDEATTDGRKPPWADDLFDPDVEGSFTHFYDEMSGGALRVGGEVLPKRYASRLPASAYLARTAGTLGQFARFNLEILEQADADVDMGRFDNDGPDGVPNSGDDDGYVDVLFINLLTVPRNFLIGGATGLASLGLNTDFLSDDEAASGGVIRVRSQFSGFGGTTQRGHVFTVTAATMCHEFAHVLGLPDLFDQSSVAADGEIDPAEDSAGIGKWGLMGLGTLGWGVEDGPNAFSAWSLAELGWLGGDGEERLEVIADSRRGIILEPIDRGGRVLKIPLTGDEYFLVENRQSTDSYYNRNIPAGGLLVWHVDERADNDEERHKQVDLVCADGLFGDRGFPGSVADPVTGGDNLDFWARDAAYAASHNGNEGDATDPFDGINYQRLSWDTNPGARGHAGGRRGVLLGFSLENITSLTGGRMSLDVLLRQPVEGNVAGDTTWTGEVLLDGDVVIEAGAVLTLAAGTQVTFAAGDSRTAGFDTTRGEIIVYGELVIAGTASDPVRIGRQGAAGRQWLGVLVPGSGSVGLEEAVSSGALILEGAALGVTRGSLPAGRTTWTGARTVPWDVIIPADAELVVDAGATVGFAPQDLSLRGVSPGFTELVVEGTLTVRGTSSAPVEFTVDSADPTQLWFGVQLVEGGTVDAEGLTLTQAGVAFGGDVTDGFRLADSRLHHLASGLRLTLFEDATLDRVGLHTITTSGINASGFGTLLLRSCALEGNGQEGVLVRNAGLQVIDSRIAGNGILDAADPRSGLVAEGGRGQRIELWNTTVEGNHAHGIDLDDWEGVFELHGSVVTGNQEDGLRADGAERVVFEEVEVARNLDAGARLVSTVSEVWTTQFDNNLGAGLVVEGGFPAVDMSHFTGNGLEMRDVARGSVRCTEFESASVGLWSTRSAPQIVGNTFNGNITALRVSGSPVPEPITENTFTANTTAIDNRSGVRLSAQQNYWGTSDSTAIAGLLTGEVDFSPYLEAEPMGMATAVTVSSDESMPGAFALRPAWPNPFNGTTMITFDLSAPTPVDLTVYDVLGQRVRNLTPARNLAAGRYTVRWDGHDDRGQPAASGIYLYHLATTAGFHASGRVVLTR